MSKNYKQTIQLNNTDLQTILTTISELPEAGNSDPILQDKTVTPTKSQQTVTADSAYDGLNQVTVLSIPSEYITTTDATAVAETVFKDETAYVDGKKLTGTFTIDSELTTQDNLISQIQTALQGKAGGSATPVLQSKTVTPGTSTKTVTPDNGYDGLSKVTVKGDSNLVAGNIKSGISIFGVNGTYIGSGTSGGGDSAMEDGLITGTITEYTNDRVTSIRYGAFYGYSRLSAINLPAVTNINHEAFACCEALTTVSFPAAISIGISAFYFCSELTTANFPVATTIGSNAFYFCEQLTSASFPMATIIEQRAFTQCGLTTANFPKVTSVGSSAFRYCKALATVSFPKVTSINQQAFAGCTALTTASFPAATTIGSSAFSSCKALTSVDFSVATSINIYAFYYCSKLTTASFPVVTFIGTQAFRFCSKLYLASFPAAITIGESAFADCAGLILGNFPKAATISRSAFQYCSKLMSIYLLGSSVVTLANISVFDGTPMSRSNYTGAFGSIFVPASLVAAYQSATNWATYKDRITAFGGGTPGSGEPDTPGPNAGIISFTVDDVIYQAEAGMTWQNWLDSPYNTDGYTSDMTGCVLGDFGGWICKADWSAVNIEELIKSDYNYIQLE